MTKQLTATERLAVLEERTETIDENVKEIRKDMKDFIAGADNKYASKSVEKDVELFKNKVVAIAITMLILMILAQYGLDKFFKG